MKRPVGSGHFNRNALTMLVIWFFAMGGLLLWDIQTARNHAHQLAINDARSNFNKDQAFRFWATRHGGVYVPANERTPPNPGLAHLPERDIKTPSGVWLTLMNPAYMMRQFSTEFEELLGVRGRITSLNLISELNTPDDWEIKALHQFELGVEEVFEFVKSDQTTYLRLMRPMFTGEGCLKCHAVQGYREGDVRGGVGVTINVAPYLADMYRSIRFRAQIYGVLWLLGTVGICTLFTLMKRRFDDQERAHALLLQQKQMTELAFADLQRLSEVMAHHFQEPARRMASFSARLLGRSQQELDEDNATSIQFIDQQARRLSDLVRDAQQYLALNHVDMIAGDEKPADTHEILKKALKDGGADKVDAQISVSGSLPRLALSSRYLYKLFLPLIDNAVRYRHPDRPLRMVISAEVDNNGRGRFAFADNGTGINEEYRGQVFDLFSRLVANAMPGTGMGLALARKIVHRCGGRIAIEDGIEGGVCVVFDLPVEEKV